MSDCEWCEEAKAKLGNLGLCDTCYSDLMARLPVFLPPRVVTEDQMDQFVEEVKRATIAHDRARKA